MRKLPIVVLGACLGLFPLPAAADHAGDPHWIQDLATQCWVFNPAPEPGEYITWTGHSCNAFSSEAYGDGTLSWKKPGGAWTIMEKGTMSKGKMTGQWTRNFADGRSELAFWSDGVMTWKGPVPEAGSQSTADSGGAGQGGSSSGSSANAGDAYLETLKRQNRENCARAAQGANIVCNPQ